MSKLFIVGCGIKFLSHLTLEIQSLIQKSDCVIFLANDPAMKKWICDNSIKAVSLDSIYFSFKDRKQAYQAISKEVINITKENKNSCFVIYGHPFFLTSSSTQIIKDIQENSLDIDVKVLPGISSLDCLLCDLRVDPGLGGLQAFESTEFINKNYTINTNSHLILWQIGVIGINTIIDDERILNHHPNRLDALRKIKERLLTWYEKEHSIVLYKASMYSPLPFERVDIPINQLDTVNIHRLATAYIPPNQ